MVCVSVFGKVEVCSPVVALEAKLVEFGGVAGEDTAGEVGLMTGANNTLGTTQSPVIKFRKVWKSLYWYSP